MVEETEEQKLEKMNKEINRWMLKNRIWFFSKYFSTEAKKESLKGFG